MLKKFKHIWFIFIALAISTISQNAVAQAPGPTSGPGECFPDCIPVDQGADFLIAIGVVLGIYFIYRQLKSDSGVTKF